MASTSTTLSGATLAREPPNKSILDLSEGAESGAGPDSATLHQALARSIRDKPSMAWGRSELVQTFPRLLGIFMKVRSDGIQC